MYRESRHRPYVKAVWTLIHSWGFFFPSLLRNHTSVPRVLGTRVLPAVEVDQVLLLTDLQAALWRLGEAHDESSNRRDQDKVSVNRPDQQL